MLTFVGASDRAKGCNFIGLDPVNLFKLGGDAPSGSLQDCCTAILGNASGNHPGSDTGVVVPVRN